MLQLYPLTFDGINEVFYDQLRGFPPLLRIYKQLLQTLNLYNSTNLVTLRFPHQSISSIDTPSFSTSLSLQLAL